MGETDFKFTLRLNFVRVDFCVRFLNPHSTSLRATDFKFTLRLNFVRLDFRVRFLNPHSTSLRATDFETFLEMNVKSQIPPHRTARNN
jgi:hypothetical protein